MMAGDDYALEAFRALLKAAEREDDFGHWLAHRLAEVAAELGSSGAIVRGRPQSWEARPVLDLARSLTGWDDQYIRQYRRRWR